MQKIAQRSVALLAVFCVLAGLVQPAEAMPALRHNPSFSSMIITHEALIPALSGAVFLRPCTIAATLFVIGLNPLFAQTTTPKAPAPRARITAPKAALTEIKPAIGITPQRAQTVLSSFLAFIERRPPTISAGPIKALLTHPVRVVNVTAERGLSVRYQPSGQTINSTAILNAYALEPLLARAARGDIAAMNYLDRLLIGTNGMLRDNPAPALFQFINHEAQNYADKPGIVQDALYAVMRVRDTWGITLAAQSNNPAVASIIGWATISFIKSSLPGQVDIDMDTGFDYAMFKETVLSRNAQAGIAGVSPAIMFASILVKEGGGAADMLARSHVYLESQNASTAYADKKFNGQDFNLANPAHMPLALRDAAFVDASYHLLGRYLYGEIAGYEPLLQFLADHKITQAALETVNGKREFAASQHLINRLLMIYREIGTAQGQERNRRLRFNALLNDVRFYLAVPFEVVLADLRRKNLTQQLPGGRNVSAIKDFVFMTDPHFTHENEERPRATPQSWLGHWGGWRVWGVVMPVVEEMLRWAPLVFFHGMPAILWMLVYPFIHTLGHYGVDRQLWRERFKGRLALSFLFGIVMAIGYAVGGDVAGLGAAIVVHAANNIVAKLTGKSLLITVPIEDAKGHVDTGYDVKIQLKVAAQMADPQAIQWGISRLAVPVPPVFGMARTIRLFILRIQRGVDHMNAPWRVTPLYRLYAARYPKLQSGMTAVIIAAKYSSIIPGLWIGKNLIDLIKSPNTVAEFLLDHPARMALAAAWVGLAAWSKARLEDQNLWERVGSRFADRAQQTPRFFGSFRRSPSATAA